MGNLSWIFWRNYSKITWTRFTGAADGLVMMQKFKKRMPCYQQQKIRTKTKLNTKIIPWKSILDIVAEQDS